MTPALVFLVGALWGAFIGYALAEPVKDAPRRHDTGASEASGRSFHREAK